MAGLAGMILMLTAESCTGRGDKSSISDTVRVSTDTVPASFHADNDIAMTIRSVADALHLGETLRDADYDYTGLLTDGQGIPLYTDLEGKPGVWKVEVADPVTVTVSNTAQGDLLAEDLTAYILSSMKLADKDMVDRSVKDGAGIVCYAFTGGYVSFRVDKKTTDSGLETAMMTITVSRNNPCG